MESPLLHALLLGSGPISRAPGPFSGWRGGRGGIRTHERVAPLAVFKTAAFVRSATLPGAIYPRNPFARPARALVGCHTSNLTGRP